MNTQFALKFIRHLSNKAHKNHGFALILACGIGLAIAAVGLTMMMRGINDDAKAFNQRQKAESLVAAEIGVNRLRQVLNENRILLTYSSDCYGRSDCATAKDYWNKINTTSSSSTDKPTFQSDLTSPQKYSCSASGSTTTLGTTDLTKLKEYAITDDSIPPTQWTSGEIDDDKAYRLITYQFYPNSTPGQAPGIGVAVIEAVSGKGKDYALSRSRVVVKMPVLLTPLPDVIKDNPPGLWLKQGAISDESGSDSIISKVSRERGYTAVPSDNNLKFAANILLSDCNIKDEYVTSMYGSLTSSTYKVGKFNIPFPSLPTPPAKTTVTTTATVTYLSNYISTLNSSETFPRKNASGVIVDKPTTRTIGGASVDLYEYIIDDIALGGSDQITIRPGERVIFYVTGNIDSSGNADIVHDCGSSTTCKSTDFQIYAGYKWNSDSTAIEIDTAPSTAKTLCIKGNATTQAFIFAPNYDVGMTGTGGYKGSVWANSWGKLQTCGSNGNKTAVNQTGNWVNILVQQPKDPLPQLGSISSWEQVGLSDPKPTAP